MTLLSSLVKAYARFPDAPPTGFTREKISAVVVLNPDGCIERIDDLRQEGKKKPVPRFIDVPKPVRRTSGIAPNFLWDKTSYSLGMTAGKDKRTGLEHAAFVSYHEEHLRGSDDEGLCAFLCFLRQWNQPSSMPVGWDEELLDSNLIFALNRDCDAKGVEECGLHLRPAAKALWAEISNGDDKKQSVCLVTGKRATIARLHPSIKGVYGAQSSGASLVSFNQDSFASYGHDQGANAPVSVYAADAYTGALNLLLARDSGNTMLIGDTTIVFWAEAADTAVARRAENAFPLCFNEERARAGIEDNNAQKIRTLLEQIREKKQLQDIDPDLEKDVRFFILGLAANAARLVVRFFLEDTFAHIIRNYQRFIDDMRIEPAGKTPYPPFFFYLSTIAAQGKVKNLPRRLEAEWMRAIFSGNCYPLTLLSATLMRSRLDGNVNALRASILKAVLVRNFEKQLIQNFDNKDFNKIREGLVMLNTECQNTGYLLGRLFAVYEQIQSAALGPNVNATVKDKFYATASVQPQKVFGIIDRNSVNHLAKVRKTKRGYDIVLIKLIGSIMSKMNPDNRPFPLSLSPQDQALFGLGYHHQRAEFFKKISVDPETAEEK